MLIHGFSPANARLLITCGTAFYAIIKDSDFPQMFIKETKFATSCLFSCTSRLFLKGMHSKRQEYTKTHTFPEGYKLNFDGIVFSESVSVHLKHMLNARILGVVGCGDGLYLSSPGCPTDIGLQFGKACYPCSRYG